MGVGSARPTSARPTRIWPVRMPVVCHPTCQSDALVWTAVLVSSRLSRWVGAPSAERRSVGTARDAPSPSMCGSRG